MLYELEKRRRGLTKIGLLVSERQVRFEDFVLQLDVRSRGGFRARVVQSSYGEGSTDFALPAGLYIADGSRELDCLGTASASFVRLPREIGRELFRSVFQGQVRTLLDKNRGKLEIAPDLGLRLKIKIDPSDEETKILAGLPWELLYDDETEDFFALSRQMSLVRYLEVPRLSQPIAFKPPLQILAVSASPWSLHPLDLDEEIQRLAALERSYPGIRVRFLTHASIRTVREALSEDIYHVLHFMGHGAFDRANGEGMLAFEAANGAPDLVSGSAFAIKLKDLRSLGVVVLNACNTGRSLRQRDANTFRGVATALVLGGVPAVVAMQRPISDRAAIGFSTAFYRHLARGDSIDEALTEGRQAIHSADTGAFEWATPVLFLRMPDGNVFVTEAERAPPAASILPPDHLPLDSRRGWILLIAAIAVLTVLLFSSQSISPSGNSPWQAGEEARMTLETRSQGLVAQQISGSAPALAPTRPRRARSTESLASIASAADRLKDTVDRSLVKSCIRQRAWMAYFQNSQGCLSPVRDTKDPGDDADWLGIRYTGFDGPRIRLGILQVNDNSTDAEENDWDGETDGLLAGIRKMLTSALFHTGRFDVIEQESRDGIEKQQAREEVTEPSPAPTLNVSNGPGPQYLVRVTVNEVSSGRARRIPREAEVAITIVLADALTDWTLFTTTEWLRLEDGGNGKDKTVHQEPASIAISACVNKAAFKIAASLRDHKWTGSVVEVNGPDVYVSAGGHQGMTPDSLLSVFTVRSIVKDTRGKVLGEDLKEIGTLSVDSVQPSFSIAHVVSGCKEIKKGDHVELAAKPVQRPIPPGCMEMDQALAP